MSNQMLLDDAQALNRDGFVLLLEVLDGSACSQLCSQIARTAEPHHQGSQKRKRPGTRNLLNHSWCTALARTLHAHTTLAHVIPANYVAVQCTYFEKSLDTNWLVPMHQDLSIPVAQRVDHPSLCGWSEKEGVLYVQPPTEFLEQVIAVRLHLDPCSEIDGPLRVIPGSHKDGRIKDGYIPEQKYAASNDQNGQSTQVTCTANAGDVLCMHPLLMHASSKATGTSKRRLLHFVFEPCDLRQTFNLPGIH